MIPVLSLILNLVGLISHHDPVGTLLVGKENA